MKIEKSFLICIFLLAILSLGFVCAEDSSLSDNDVSGEIAVEDIQSNANILSASPEDSDSALSNESDSDDKEILGDIVYYDTEIYPWTWADSDSHSGRGILFYWSNEYELTENSTVYMDDEIIDVFQGDECLITPETLWQHYRGGKDMHMIKFAYPGDEHYKPSDHTIEIYLLTHYCELDRNVVQVNLPSNVSGVLTVIANGRTILTEYIQATYHRYEDYSAESYWFALEGLDSGVNHIEVSFRCDSDMYSFDEYFEYYNADSNEVIPNPENNTGNSSTFHREVMAGNDSKAVGSVAAGNPLLVLALAISSVLLLPRRK